MNDNFKMGEKNSVENIMWSTMGKQTTQADSSYPSYQRFDMRKEAKGSNLLCIDPSTSFVCLSKQSNIWQQAFGKSLIHSPFGGGTRTPAEIEPNVRALSRSACWTCTFILLLTQQFSMVIDRCSIWGQLTLQNILDYFNFGQKNCRKIKRLNVRNYYSKVYISLSSSKAFSLIKKLILPRWDTAPGM